MMTVEKKNELSPGNSERRDDVLRMLIVDEDYEDQAFIARLFDNLGIEMDWATSGFQALRKIHRGYDLVVTALSTADMDGIELLLRIKQVDANVEVIVTGRDLSEETVSLVMRQGAFCYLTKPFANKDTVVRAIRRALDRRRETRKEEALYRSLILGQTVVVDSDSGPYEIPFSKTQFPAVDLLSLMNDGFVFLDAKGHITFANVKFSRKLNWPYRSILNKQFAKYVLREDRDSFFSFLDQIRESRIGIHETRMVNRMGRVIHMMVTCRQFDMEEAAQTLLVITDITDKRRAEERARMLATLVDRAKFEAILVHNDQSRIIHCNKAALEMFGYPSHKLIGTNLDALFRRDTEQDRITLVSTSPGDAAYELFGIHYNGTTFPVEVSESMDKGDDDTAVGLLFARDITKRKNAETDLLAANEQLKAMNEELIFVREAQRRFFANMSHELKTPLNAVGGYASLMLEGVGGDLCEKHVKWVDSIKRQSNHLLLIIQEILEFAKLDKKNETKVSLKTVRSESLVQEIAAATVALVGKKPVEVITVLSPDPPTITTDIYRLRQVLMNLAANAVKFTSQGTISIGIQPVDTNRAAFFVADTGVGIAASEIPNIFNDFYQIEHQETADFGGCGLGLAIVRRLVARLNGTVQVESAPYKGSKFIVILPIDPTQYTEESAVR